jgi:NAD(P)H-hydrate epimerase
MREVDRWAIEELGVAGLELMERAGAAVAQAVERLTPDGAVTVVCGKGNNGGDGLVVARLLQEAGHEVRVLCTNPLKQFSGDAQTNLQRLPGPRPICPKPSAWAAIDTGEWGAVVVDALLGTGFDGEPHGAVADAIEAINHASVPVVSVDIPSGVDASSGEVAGSAVRATVTVTFHAAKPGLWIRPGKALAGVVETADIGVPRGAPIEASVGLIDDAIGELMPRREAASTKFTSGHVLVVGGSPGLTGAPTLAAHGAMRAGAGYVTACIPASLEPTVAARSAPELMTVALPDVDGALAVAGVARVIEASARGGAIVLGPGLGRADGAAQFAVRLAREADVPLVLDADGLNAHAGRLSRLADRDAPTVLTPHAGELGRLLDLDSAEIEHSRLAHARAAAATSGAVVVLKGDDTLVAAPDGTVAVSAGASPALATAGTGDVLGGTIAALLSGGLDAFESACAGVWLHARAGRLAAQRFGGAEGVTASDVIAALAPARTVSAGMEEGGDD